MKKLLLILLGTISAAAGQAQMPVWLIPPTSDTIFVKLDDHLLQSVEGGTSKLWTMDGKLVYSTDNTILQFKNGAATVVDKDNGRIVGFVNPDGDFTSLPRLSVAFDNPFFEDGFLTALDHNEVVYYDLSGSKRVVPYAERAYPFHNGYAPYLSYIQPEKKKDPYYSYYTVDGDFVNFQMTDIKGDIKKVEPTQIEFLSGISSTGKGVGVIKGKVYWINPSRRMFEPFLWGNLDSDKKRHLTLVGDYERYLMNLPSDSVEIVVKYGKNQTAVLKFDDELVPVSFTFEDDVVTFPEETVKTTIYPSNISSFSKGSGKNTLYGLAYKDKKVLPDQFSMVGLMIRDNAVVKLDGKWGMLQIIPGLEYSLKINKGDDVPFRHQKFETQVRLDLPPEISAKDARIDIPASTGCLLDKTSREVKDTESGNFVTYNCVLTIPKSLPNEKTRVTYFPVSVTFDGFKEFDDTLSIMAWHYKYYNVDPIDTETSVAEGVATFTVDVNVQKNVSDGDYHFNVYIEADSVSVESEKLSETRYKYFVSNLVEGANTLNIIVEEDGCPPSSFPFEIFYTKPKPKEKKQEEVTVRKKAPVKKEEPAKTKPEFDI